MKRKERYKLNKGAKVGEEIACPVCNDTFVKKQYSQAFCCGQCKDKYWNAKKDRHKAGYYEEYDSKRPERMARRIVYGSTQVVSIGGELTLRAVEEIEWRRAGIRRHIDTYGLLGDHPHDIDGGLAEAEF